MRLPFSTDAQVEWFHNLAALPEAELRIAANSGLQQLFAEFVAAHLPGHSPPAELSPQEFASAVSHLRANERRWNRALQWAIIEADDHSKRQESGQAVRLLQAFAAQCPWARFREVAMNQSTYYEANP